MTTTTSFLALASGEVRFTFDDSASLSALDFQLIDPAGQPRGASHRVAEGHSSGAAGQPSTHIDLFDAAALSGGGFTVAYDTRVSDPTNGGLTENLSVVQYDAAGQLRTTHTLVIAADVFPAGSLTTAHPFDLGGDRFAVLYDAPDGSVSARHLGVEMGLGPSDMLDVRLASAPTHIDQTGGGLTLSFANGDQVLVAGGPHTSLLGGPGNDTLVGSASADFDNPSQPPAPDVLRGGDGNDVIHGGHGFDDINGNKGDDTIDGGGSGSDWLVGGQGNDLIQGQNDFSILYGNLGNDTLIGGTGGEWLRGGQGDDSIFGGFGADWISGDRGNDTETGGGGADTFNGFAGIGTDRIVDFSVAEGDRIQLDPGTAWSVSQVGADTVVDLGNGDKMTLVGVQFTTLPAGWIFGF